MRSMLLRCVLLGSAVMAVPAAAQTALTGVDTVATEGERRVDLTLSGRAQYDSNISLTNKATADRRGLDRADVRFSPAANVDINLPTGAASFSLRGVVGYDFYNRNHQLNRERIDLNAGIAAAIAICSVALNAGYARRQSDLGDLDLLITNDGRSVKNVETVQRAGAVLGCGAPVGLRPFGLFQYENSRNSSEIRRGQNVESFTYGGGLEYNQPSIGTIRAFAGVRELDFNNRGTLQFPGATNVRVVAGGVGFRRDVGARLSVDGEILYANVDLPGSGNKSYNGLSWRLQAGLRATSVLGFTLKAGRQITPGLGFVADYIIQQEYSLEARLAIGQRAMLSVQPHYRKRDYRNSIAPAAGLMITTGDETIGISSQLTYQLGEKVGLLLDVGYDKRNANLDIYDVGSFRTGVGVELKL